MKNVYFIQAGMHYGKAVYLPYAAGCLAAYAWRDTAVSSVYENAGFLFSRDDTEQALLKIRQPYLAAFSCSVWNREYNKNLARKIKRKYPECLIVYGGHDITDGAEDLHRMPFVDILVHGEGEKPFALLLKALAAGDGFSGVPNISYRLADKTPVSNDVVATESPKDYPSPYLTGMFDRLLAENPGVEFCGVLETNRGCPYQCAYCDWCFTDKTNLFPLEKAESEIEWFSRHKIDYVFCADANFGIFERDLTVARRVAEARKKTGFPALFSATYAKNSNDTVFEIAKLLEGCGAIKAATLAVQTLNPEAMDFVSRKNIGAEDFSALLRRYNRAGIATYTEIILGLPGETYESFCKGLCELIEAGQHSSLTVYNCQVYRNTALWQSVYRAKYGIETVTVPLNHIHALPPQKGEITEYVELVAATSTLSREGMVDCLMFSTCLQCFHHLGLLKFVAVYLRHEHSVSYFDFYSRLLAYIFRAEGTFLNGLFRKLKHTARDLREGEATYYDERFGGYGWYLEEGAFMEIVFEHDTFLREIRPFLDGFGMESDVYRELLKYQAQTVRKPPHRTVRIESAYDFFGYFAAVFAGGYRRLEKKKTAVSVRVSNPVSGWTDYARVVMLFAKKRGGTLLTSDKEAVTVDCWPKTPARKGD